MNTFRRANTLIPQVEDMERWSVIACDQYTSQPDYWKKVRRHVGDKPSSLNLILPEAEMHEDYSLEKINDTMEKYIVSGVFKEYKDAYIYVERTLSNGKIRKGIVGMVDLEQYDYSDDASTQIRATERTVKERIPARMEIRRSACIEMPHILLLCDDEKHKILETAEQQKTDASKLYEFDLMEKGGHISGWLIQGDAAQQVDEQINEYALSMEEKYAKKKGNVLLYAVGDGNHSLASAKACYEELKHQKGSQCMLEHPARYALVELENIHDDSQEFEAIHRIITDVDAEGLLNAVKKEICADEGYPVGYCMGDKVEKIYLRKELGEIPVAILQKFLDEYLADAPEKIDYIHGEKVVKELAGKDNSIGFILPVIEKNQFFNGIIKDGVLPRKTFSMGHAHEKRYYLEARRIKN